MEALSAFVKLSRYNPSVYRTPPDSPMSPHDSAPIGIPTLCGATDPKPSDYVLIALFISSKARASMSLHPANQMLKLRQNAQHELRGLAQV